MLSLYQGYFELSFKKWTGLQNLQDRGLKHRQDFRIYRIVCLKIKMGPTMNRVAGLQDLMDC